MRVAAGENGNELVIKLTRGEAAVLCDELGDVPARHRKIRQLYTELLTALDLFADAERSQRQSERSTLSARPRGSARSKGRELVEESGAIPSAAQRASERWGMP